MTGIETIRRWVELLNAGDVEQILELYGEETSLTLCFAPRVDGKAAISAMFRAWFAAAPLHCIVEQLYAADGDRVILQWRDRVGLLGCNLYTVRQGRIVEQHNYFDQLSFLKLNGLPLPPQ